MFPSRDQLMIKQKVMLHFLLYILVFHGVTCDLLALKGLKEKGCDYKRASSDLNATFIISAMFPIQTQKNGTYIYDMYGITWVESFLYAIDAINANDSILPNITLGFDIRNTCDDEQVALEHALDFMLDQQYISSKSVTNNTRSQANACCMDGRFSNIFGVVGGARSIVSSYMSSLFMTRNITQISYASSSPSLSRKSTYPSFLRTVPSDVQQIEATVALLQRLNWTYISVIAADDDYGRLARDSLQRKLKSVDICLAVNLLFDPELGTREIKKIAEALKRVNDRTQVVALWCSLDEGLKIMQETKDAGLEGIIWIFGTESWDIRLVPWRANRGGWRVIAVTPGEFEVPSFTNHMKQLEYNSRLKNIWWDDMWREFSICIPARPANSTYDDCFNKTPSGSTLPTTQHENVMASVYALAYGLHDMLGCDKDLSCGERIDHSKPFDHNKLLSAIKNRIFHVPGTTIRMEFDRNGDVQVNMYEFFLLGGINFYTRFGEWSGKTNSIVQLDKEILWKNFDQSKRPNATCSHPCPAGTYVLPDSVVCCWECIPCMENEISSTFNAKQCHPCQKTQTPDENHTECIEMQDKTLSIHSDSGKSLLAVSSLGVLLTCATVICFIKHWNTPLVKSSSREMSLVQLFCMIILFSLPVLLIFRVSYFTCILQITVFGICHSAIVAFIFIKTYRLLKVFQPKRFTEISKYLHNRYQMIPSAVLVLVQITVLIVWYSVHPPTLAVWVDVYDKSYVQCCDEHEEVLLYAIVGYIMLMSLMTGYMGFLARKLPSNFNEANYIWLAMFTSCLAWCCFFPLHLSAPQWNKRVILLSVNAVSTFTLLFVLYLYKIRIVIFHPHLNSQEHFSKLAANATVKTFMKDVKPGHAGISQQPRRSVMTFDFDGMFEEYKTNTQRKQTFRQNLHFPSMRNIRKSLRLKKKASTKKEKRRRTVELAKKNRKERMSHSVSIDESKTHPTTNQTTFNNDNISITKL